MSKSRPYIWNISGCQNVLNNGLLVGTGFDDEPVILPIDCIDNLGD
jgi:hypothetical protein